MGKRAENTVVNLVPHDYNPLTDEPLSPEMTDATGEDGIYRFMGVDSGIYNIQAAHQEDGTRLLIHNIHMADQDIWVPMDTLRVPGTIVIPLSDNVYVKGGYVYITGTVYYMQLESDPGSTGYIVLDSVPPGTVSSVTYTEEENALEPVEIVSNVDVAPEDTNNVPSYLEWSHTRKIYLNTTSTGADVSGDVTGFPVLVRLDHSNFTFSEADPDGNDVRFSSSRERSLPYQIERWSNADETAEIWVRVDTLLGNNNAQFIKMHWGREDALSWSDGSRVFSPASGFGAVWHLGEREDGTGSKAVYRNSAADENHGDDWIVSEDNSGLIGNGSHFEKDDFIQVPLAASALKPVSSLAVSGWFRTNTSDSSGAQIASMGDDYGLRLVRGGSAALFLFDDPTNNFVVYSSRQDLFDSSWHHAAGVYTGTELLLYVDGVLEGSRSHNVDLWYNIGPDFFIGIHGTQFPFYDFVGYMDEIRVSSVPRSAGWIKLCFENQKESQVLIEFR
jgi:hypothetical protein